MRRKHGERRDGAAELDEDLRVRGHFDIAGRGHDDIHGERAFGGERDLLFLAQACLGLCGHRDLVGLASFETGVCGLEDERALIDPDEAALRAGAEDEQLLRIALGGGLFELDANGREARHVASRRGYGEAAHERVRLVDIAGIVEEQERAEANGHGENSRGNRTHPEPQRARLPGLRARLGVEALLE